MAHALRVLAEADHDLSPFGIDRSRVVVEHVLALCAGHVISRERIYEHVWRRPMPHPRDRAVDVHIGRLRSRLAELSPDWRYIHTHFGHGYRFDPERAEGGP